MKNKLAKTAGYILLAIVLILASIFMFSQCTKSPNWRINVDDIFIAIILFIGGLIYIVKILSLHKRKTQKN